MTGRRLVVLLCATIGLLVAGCATIPAETVPQRADLQNGNVSGGVAQPPRDDDPLAIVRDFVSNNGDPANQHATARAYLEKTSQNQWLGRTPPSAVIIKDVFSTTYGDDDPGANERDVLLATTLLGILNPDGSFQPPGQTQAGEYQLSLQVKKGPNGLWRILNPPDGLVLTESDFAKFYRPVSVYFFDPGGNVLVPDPRYVVTDPIGQPGRIIQLLLDGPSEPVKDAVVDAIPPGTTLKTNVTELPDGEIFVNFKGLPDLPSNTKQLIVAQIVRSLQNFGSSVIVDSEGVPLVSAHSVWRPADLPSYAPHVGPSATPLVVAHNKIYNLATDAPIAGPAGNGDYDVITAAQSVDGQELATVTRRTDGTEELRIGPLKSFDQPVKDLTGRAFTRPTWEPSDAAGDPSRALWTVVNGAVVRVVSTPNSWVASPVDASELTQYGAITDLRLSMDGVRVAVAAGGHLLVGSVVNDQGSVSIQQAQELQPDLDNVVRVDWLRQDQLVVVTNGSGPPVQSVSVDGQKLDVYSQANLTSAVTAVAASQNGPVLVSDAGGVWSSTDINDVWALVPRNQPAGAIPFYPG